MTRIIPPLKNTENRLFYIALAASAVIICLLGLPLFQNLVYKYGDLGNYHIPLRYFYAKSLKASEGFAWLPNIYCGFYLHGDGAVGMCHPLHLFLYRVFPLSVAFNLEFLFSYPFMLVGMYFFLRRWSLPRDASMLGSMIFAFSGFNLLHFLHLNGVLVVAHIPWLLLAIDVAMRDDNQRHVALALLGIGLLTASELLLGHPQKFWFSSLTELVYAVCLAITLRNPRRFLMLGVAKLAGCLGGCAQLMPTYDVVSHSTRHAPASEYLYQFSIHPINALQFVAPYFFKGRVYGSITHEYGIYIGAMPLLLAAWLVVRQKRSAASRNLAIGACGFGILAFLLSLGEYGYLYRLQTALPLLGLFRVPCRYIVLFHFTTAILAAIGFANLSELNAGEQATRWWRLWPIAFLPVFSIVPIVLLVWPDLQLQHLLAPLFLGNIASRELVVVGPVLFGLAALLIVMASRGMKFALAAIILFAAIDQGFYGLSYIWQTQPVNLNEFADSVPLPPDAEKYRMQSGHNIFIMKGIRLSGGYAPLTPQTYLEEMNLTRLRLAGAKWVWSKHPEYAGGRSFGYPLAEPLPRVRMVSDVKFSDNPAQDLEEIDVETTALVDDRIELPAGEPGTAAIVNDRPGKIKITTEADSKQFLVLSESYHHGWQARIDGDAAPVRRAYGDFMGCIVDAGRHEVEFVFRPKSMRHGIWLSILGFTLMFSFLLLPLTVRKDTG